MAKSETALATVDVKSFMIAQMGRDDVREMMEANVGPSGINMNDIDRVSIPGSGGTMWQVPNASGETEAFEEITGVIVWFRDGRVYFSQSMDESDGGPPDCYSDDTIVGHGEPGGACADCLFSQFGSAKKGKGQACQQRRTLLMIRENDVIPIAINLPPTSLKACRKFFLSGLRGPHWTKVVSIGLAQDKNTNGIKYSTATFKVVGDVPAELTPMFKGMRDALRGETSEPSAA